MRRFLPAKLAALVARTPRRPLRRPLAVESLEARDVPASYTWTPTAPGAYDWNDAANWSGGPAGTFPNAVDDVANLTGALVGNQVVRLNTGITIGTLNLGSTSTAGGFTVLANGGSLTFDVTAGSATLDDTNTGGDAVLAPDLHFHERHDLARRPQRRRAVHLAEPVTRVHERDRQDLRQPEDLVEGIPEDPPGQVRGVIGDG